MNYVSGLRLSFLFTCFSGILMLQSIEKVGGKCMKQLQKIDLDEHLGLAAEQVQSLEILQMDAVSLEEYIDKRHLENPVLEYNRPASRLSGENGSWIENTAQEENMYETLEFFLNDQIDRLSLPEKEKKLCKMIVPMVDENGYLDQELLAGGCIAKQELRSAVKVLKSLEPAGIAAESLSECLLLQLVRAGKGKSLAACLVRDHLNDLAGHYYKKLSKIYQCSLEEIEDAVEEILSLDPKPGAAFVQRKRTVFIQPDFYIGVQDETIVIVKNEKSFPRLTLNSYYEELYHASEDESVKAYLQSQLTEAKSLIRMLDRRNSTLELCVEQIVHIQEEFFRNTSAHLKPLSLADTAKQLGLHESTVSRAIHGKYIEFKKKVYPLKYFYVRRAAGEYASEMSVEHVKALLREIIKNEAPASPLTDEEIVKILQCGGCKIARRTAAKYRGEMMIPSSKKRKRYER